MSKKGINNFKIVLLGETSIGKITLCRRYMGEGFQENYLATLCAEFVIKEQDDVRLLIWDIGGHRNFMNIIESYLQCGHGLVLVYDIIRPVSLETINKWVDYFIKANDKIVPTILVANKIDLRKPGDSSVNAETAKRILINCRKNIFKNFNMLKHPP